MSWSAIWIGSLAALAAGLMFGLMGTPSGRNQEASIIIMDWHVIPLRSGLPEAVEGLSHALTRVTTV